MENTNQKLLKEKLKWIINEKHETTDLDELIGKIISLFTQEQENFARVIDERLSYIEIGLHPTPREMGLHVYDSLESNVEGMDYVIKQVRNILANY
jgi:hypothetical protein